MDYDRQSKTTPSGGIRSTAAAAIPWLEPSSQRQRRGRKAHYTGLAAEDSVVRHYEAAGAEVRHRRHRTPYGELDLVVSHDGVLVFVEVKRRKHGLGPDSPVSSRQWQRLENAALHYMMALQNQTGVQPVCRFDVAIVDRNGTVQIIENARSFDEY